MYTLVPRWANLVPISQTRRRRLTDKVDGATGDLNLRHLVSPPVLVASDDVRTFDGFRRDTSTA